MQAARSLLLITVDCLRADHVGFLGYRRPTTPFLDCLAGDGFVFENAIAAGSPTYYSLPALHASRYPLALGRDLIGVAPGETTLASILQESGLVTAAFTAANPYISPRFGYDSGFDIFRDFLGNTDVGFEPAAVKAPGLRAQANQVLARACHAVPPFGVVYDELYFQYLHGKSRNSRSLERVRRFPTADVLVDHATAWLNENSGQPFFLWLHFMDPHYPYVPKPEALEYLGEKRLSGHEVEYLNSYWNRGDLSTARLMRKRDDVVKLYDAGIRWVDEQVRRLTETLVDLNLWDKCVLALTADHGEEFLDHGGRFHAPEKLTEELIRVPLLIRVPGVAGRRVEDVISHVDVAPTLLDILDLPAPADFRGRSSWGSVTSNRRWERHAITECVQGCTNPFQTNKRMGSRVVSIRKREHKLVMHFSAGREEFFDLTTDHGERNPIPPGQNDPSRRELLKLARKHVAESRKSRDFDRRRALLLRDLRLEWAHSATQVLQ